MIPDNQCHAPMFIIARNPKPNARLPYLACLPVAGEAPLVLATSDTWPTGRDLFCYQLESWPEKLEVLEAVPVQSCRRAGKAVHLVLKRRQRRRSMFIWTESKGRTLIFWRTQQTMQAARPGIRVPTARGLERRTVSIAIDHRERYPWKFPHQHAYTERRELPTGDYGIFFGNRLIAAVERKTVADLAGALSSGTLRMQLVELSSLPRGCLVIEGRLSDLVKAEKKGGVSTGWLLNLVAALQAEYPNVQWIFAETRGMAQDMAYRWLSAAAVVLRGQIETQKETQEGLDPDSWRQTDPEETAHASYSPSGIVPTTSQTSIVAEDLVEGNAAAPVYVKDRLGRHREALLLAQQGCIWTISSYQEHFQVSAATAYNDIKDLIEQGHLTSTGSKHPKQYVYRKE
ncbi:MAG TPA: hypothetical protein GX509_11900 [Firmicutes bacterium]|nr:hypothetical protein [Bacillota bacterium]